MTPPFHVRYCAPPSGPSAEPQAPLPERAIPECRAQGRKMSIYCSSIICFKMSIYRSSIIRFLDDIIPKKTNLKRLHDGTWRLQPFFTKTADTPRQLIQLSVVLATKNRRMAIFANFNRHSPVFARSSWPISLSTAILGFKWCATESF